MILVYFDQGVDPLSARQLIKEFRCRNLEVKRVNHKTLLEPLNAHLLVMPGGLDIWYHKLLSGQACDNIRTFVQNGGCYLGICAGAYFGSKQVDFERGYKHAIVAERELSFFPGRAEGPALGLGTFDPNSRSGASIAQITFQGKELSVFYNGGCRFVDSDQGEVLGRWMDGTPAIIQLDRVILCGVHPEYSASGIGTADPHLNALDFTSIEEDRIELFSSLASALGV